MLLGTWPTNARFPAVKATVFQLLHCALDDQGVGFYKTSQL